MHRPSLPSIRRGLLITLLLSTATACSTQPIAAPPQNQFQKLPSVATKPVTSGFTQRWNEREARLQQQVQSYLQDSQNTERALEQTLSSPTSKPSTSK